MDGHLAIEHNRQALLRIVATLVAMADVGSGRATLPRRLRNAVLRLLRPAEAAARRLAIALARGLVVVLPPQRRRTQRPGLPIVKNGVGTGIFLPRGMTARAAFNRPHGELAEPEPVEPEPLEPVTIGPRPRALPLLDPPRAPFLQRVKSVAAHRMPRISAPGISGRKPLPPQPSRDDELDARRLGLRLAALGAALDDLPKQALRFARWQARQKRTRDSLAEAARHDRACHGAIAGQAAGPDRTMAFRRPLRRGRPAGVAGLRAARIA